MKEVMGIALLAAKAAGDAILKHYDNYDLTFKNDRSPLTSADLVANDAIFSYLEKTGIDICSEERILEYEKRDESSKFWLIDPLDGTKEFISKNGEFCVCIALIEFGRPVLGVIYIPFSNEMFYSSGNSKVYKNGFLISESLIQSNSLISGSHSYSQNTQAFADRFKFDIVKCGSAMKFCRLVEGKASIYPRFCNSSIWDIAAGDFLLSQSGGKVVSLKNHKELRYDNENLKNDYFLAVNKNLVPNLNSYLKFIQNIHS